MACLPDGGVPADFIRKNNIGELDNRISKACVNSSTKLLYEMSTTYRFFKEDEIALSASRLEWSLEYRDEINIWKIPTKNWLTGVSNAQYRWEVLIDQGSFLKLLEKALNLKGNSILAKKASIYFGEYKIAIQNHIDCNQKITTYDLCRLFHSLLYLRGSEILDVVGIKTKETKEKKVTWYVRVWRFIKRTYFPNFTKQ